MIDIKILSCRPTQRYAVRQTAVAAKRDLQNEYPDLKINITNLKDWVYIERYTLILSAPSLLVNEKLVCEGRFPSREEVLSWLKSALSEE